MASTVEGSYAGQLIPQLAAQSFVGNATDCLKALGIIAGPDGTRHPAWPSSPKGMGNLLRRLKPGLAEAGILVDLAGPTGHGRKRIIRNHQASDPSAAAASSCPSASL